MYPIKQQFDMSLFIITRDHCAVVFAILFRLDIFVQVKNEASGLCVDNLGARPKDDFTLGLQKCYPGYLRVHQVLYCSWLLLGRVLFLLLWVFHCSAV